MSEPPSLTKDEISRWLVVSMQVYELAPEGRFEGLFDLMRVHYPAHRGTYDPVVLMAAMFAYLDRAMSEHPKMAPMRSAFLRGGGLLTAFEDLLRHLG